MRVLITGAARAIGAATAAELSAAGHQVIATARDTTLLAGLDVAARLRLDVTDEESIRSTLERAGDLDAIVNNAAGSGKGPLESYPIERLRAMFETNTIGPLRLLQGVLPTLEEPRKRRGGQRQLGAGSGGHPPRGSVLGVQVGARVTVRDPALRARATSGSGSSSSSPGYIAPGMKAADDVAGDDAYRQLWEEWERDRRHPDRCGGADPGPTSWPRPSARPSRTPPPPAGPGGRRRRRRARGTGRAR